MIHTNEEPPNEEQKTALSVDCPRCDSLAGEYCVIIPKRGHILRRRSEPHAQRIQYLNSPE
jgi:hypothetical protein